MRRLFLTVLGAGGGGLLAGHVPINTQSAVDSFKAPTEMRAAAGFDAGNSGHGRVIIAGDELASVSAALRAADTGAKVTIVRSAPEGSLFGGLVSRSGQTSLDRDFTNQIRGQGLTHGYYEKILDSLGIAPIGGARSVSLNPQQFSKEVFKSFQEKGIDVISGVEIQPVLNSAKNRLLGLNLSGSEGTRFLAGSSFIDTTQSGTLFGLTGAKNLGSLASYGNTTELKGAGLLGVSPIPTVHGLDWSDVDTWEQGARQRLAAQYTKDPHSIPEHLVSDLHIPRSGGLSDLELFKKTGSVARLNSKSSALVGGAVGWDFNNWMRNKGAYSNIISKYAPSTYQGAALTINGFNLSNPAHNAINFNGIMFRTNSPTEALGFEMGAPPTQDMHKVVEGFGEYLQERIHPKLRTTVNPEVYTRESQHWGTSNTVTFQHLANQQPSNTTFTTFSYQNDTRGQYVSDLHLHGRKPQLQLGVDMGQSAEIENLMGASKAIGATPAVQGIYRIEQNLAAMGEMAGYRSGMAAMHESGVVANVSDTLVLKAMRDSGFVVRKGYHPISIPSSIVAKDAQLIAPRNISTVVPIAQIGEGTATKVEARTFTELAGMFGGLGGFFGAGIRRRRKAKGGGMASTVTAVAQSTAAVDLTPLVALPAVISQATKDVTSSTVPKAAKQILDKQRRLVAETVRARRAAVKRAHAAIRKSGPSELLKNGQSVYTDPLVAAKLSRPERLVKYRREKDLKKIEDLVANGGEITVYRGVGKNRNPDPLAHRDTLFYTTNPEYASEFGEVSSKTLTLNKVFNARSPEAKQLEKEFVDWGKANTAGVLDPGGGWDFAAGHSNMSKFLREKGYDGYVAWHKGGITVGHLNAPPDPLALNSPNMEMSEISRMGGDGLEIFEPHTVRPTSQATVPINAPPPPKVESQAAVPIARPITKPRKRTRSVSAKNVSTGASAPPRFNHETATVKEYVDDHLAGNKGTTPEEKAQYEQFQANNGQEIEEELHRRFKAKAEEGSAQPSPPRPKRTKSTAAKRIKPDAGTKSPKNPQAQVQTEVEKTVNQEAFEAIKNDTKAPLEDVVRGFVRKGSVGVRRGLRLLGQAAEPYTNPLTEYMQVKMSSTMRGLAAGVAVLGVGGWLMGKGARHRTHEGRRKVAYNPDGTMIALGAGLLAMSRTRSPLVGLGALSVAALALNSAHDVNRLHYSPNFAIGKSLVAGAGGAVAYALTTHYAPMAVEGLSTLLARFGVNTIEGRAGGMNLLNTLAKKVPGIAPLLSVSGLGLLVTAAAIPTMHSIIMRSSARARRKNSAHGQENPAVVGRQHTQAGRGGRQKTGMIMDPTRQQAELSMNGTLGTSVDYKRVNRGVLG